jgi:hypothetical protein
MDSIYKYLFPLLHSLLLGYPSILCEVSNLKKDSELALVLYNL